MSKIDRIRYSILLDKELVEKGKTRAASNRQKFNGYVESLIEADLKNVKSEKKQS
jgi:hypothetical protein